MPGRIPWERMSGEEIETIVAIYVCRTRPNAQRFRPSQGDGGIDILVENDDGTYDVYQVKKFATSLGSSQKRQIAESWKAVQEYVSEHKWVLKNWYLVLPLDPTPQNKEWFDRETANDGGIKCHWLGLTNIDAWATEMPEVYDYYMAEGRAQVDETLNKILSATNKPDLRKADELEEKMREYADILNSIDPSYAYTVHLISKYDKQGAKIMNRPGLMYTAWGTCSDGNTVVFEAIEKYAAASEIAPLKFKGLISAANEEENQQLIEYVKYGTPFKDVTMKNFKSDAFLLKGFEDSSVLKMSIKDSAEGTPLPLVIVSDGKSVLLEQLHRTYGNAGAKWQGQDRTGVIRLELKVSKDSGDAELQFSFCLSELPGSAVREALKAVAFLEALKRTEMFELRMVNGDTVQECPFKSEDLPFQSAELQVLEISLKALYAIHEKGDYEFKCPDFETIKRNAEQWIVAADLLRGETICQCWRNIPFTKDFDGEIQLPAYVQGVCKIKVCVGERDDVYLGLEKWWCRVGAIQPVKGASNGECVLLPPAQGNNYLFRCKVDDSEAKNIGGVKFCPLNESDQKADEAD